MCIIYKKQRKEMFELTKMHKSVILSKNGTWEGIVSEVEAFGERERVKTIKKKGYLESADELQSLRGNLSLHIRGKQETIGVLKVE